MRYTVLAMVVAVFGLSLVSGAAAHEGHDHDSESAPTLKLETLMKATLDPEFTKGREIVVSMVEIPPHTTMPWHWHPGEEFIYVLEGECDMLIDGEDAVPAKTGDTFHVKFKQVHTARTGDHAARALVFRVHTEGEPERVPVEKKN